MSSILEKIVHHKLGEVEAAKQRVPLAELEVRLSGVAPPLDFCSALTTGTQQGRVSLIAEVKKASPSKGVIRDDFDPVAIASTYARSGATCISVLTDEHFFQGHLDYLVNIRQAVSIPLLRKDFVLDEYQVVEARAAGAPSHEIEAGARACTHVTVCMRAHVHARARVPAGYSAGPKLVTI